ncbi:MAG: hypothetical protein RLN90_14440 [Balneolaceae bacterium]
MKYLPILLILLFLQGCDKEELVPGFPENNYLLEESQRWGENSGLERLPDKNLGEGSLELRYWSGFGLFGNKGVIINRINDKWNAYSIDVRMCDVLSQKVGIPDSLKNLVIIDIQYTDQINCNIESDENIISEVHQFTDSVFVSELQNDYNFDKLWKQLKREGILNLPIEVERSYAMTDGHSYVIEIKIGEDYRAFISANFDEFEVDIRAREMAGIIDETLGTTLNGSSW